jgi:hypothetical protein
MFKKLLISAAVFLFYALPLQAQNVHFELSYQSFRPFIHFHLDYESRSYHHDYETAYLKGYMDGVNDSYYYDHRYHDLVRDARIYEAGYRDGFRDRELMIRLRGHRWYHLHRFAYNDYYDPSYSVRIWLDGLSIAFIHAPAHRLPRHWNRRAHPHVKKYRGWIAKKHYKNKYKYKGYKSAVNLGTRYSKRDNLYERQDVKARSRYRSKSAYKNHSGKNGLRQNHGTKVHRGKGNRIEKSRERQRKITGKNDRPRRKAVKEQKRTPRKRGTVKRNRGGSKKEKSNRSRSRGKNNRGGN